MPPYPHLLRPALACSLALACTSTAPPPTPSPAPTTKPDPAPAPTILTITTPDPAASTLELTAIDSAYGSTGPVPADAPPPYFVLAILELRTTHPITTLRLTSLELFDATSTSLGKADRELSLHVTAPDATLFSPTTTDTPLPATITPDHPLRLRLHARMEDAFAERVTTTQPATYQATLHTDTDAIIRLSGPIGPPWPTG